MIDEPEGLRVAIEVHAGAQRVVAGEQMDVLERLVLYAEIPPTVARFPERAGASAP
jgi:hypothetical protein